MNRRGPIWQGLLVCQLGDGRADGHEGDTLPLERPQDHKGNSRRDQQRAGHRARQSCQVLRRRVAHGTIRALCFMFHLSSYRFHQITSHQTNKTKNGRRRFSFSWSFVATSVRWIDCRASRRVCPRTLCAITPSRFSRRSRSCTRIRSCTGTSRAPTYSSRPSTPSTPRRSYSNSATSAAPLSSKTRSARAAAVLRPLALWEHSVSAV